VFVQSMQHILCTACSVQNIKNMYMHNMLLYHHRKDGLQASSTDLGFNWMYWHKQFLCSIFVQRKATIVILHWLLFQIVNYNKWKRIYWHGN
jgi:hypothetical protein